MNKSQMISVIIPVYNVENYLNRCIDSVLDQTYSNLEIILVDDGSTDNSSKICDEYTNKDNRIITFHKNNGGLSSARNFGLKHAKGELISYIDSDDYIERDAYSELLRGFKNDEVDFVYGTFLEQLNHGKVIKRQRSNLISGRSYTQKQFIIESIKKNEWYAPAWNNIYRKEFLINNNLFFKEGIIFEDMEILPRLCLSASRIGYINYPFYHYIHREFSIMTSNDITKKKNMSIMIWKEWFDYFKKIDDPELQKYLNGILVKYYLTTCRNYKIDGWKVKDLNYEFAMKYALNFKEKMKVLFFNYFPEKYISL